MTTQAAHQRLLLFALAVVLAGALIAGSVPSAAQPLGQPGLDPARPAEPATERYIAPVAHIGGVPHALLVSGAIAYVGVGSRLDVLDVSDRAAPVLVGQATLPGSALGLALSGSHIYVAAAEAGFLIIDVTRADKPVQVASLDTLGRAMQVEIAGDRAFVADTAGGLRVIDISDPAHPAEVGSYTRSNARILDLALGGSYAYALGTEQGSYMKIVWVIDISDPAHPAEVHQFQDPCFGNVLALAGSYLYSAGSYMCAYDVSTPLAPRAAGQLNTEDARSISIAGSVAYLSARYQANELWVVDISMPAAPAILGTLDLTSSISALDASGQSAYVSTSLGFQVIDVSNPAAPTTVGYRPTPGNPTAVSVAGNYAYAATDRGLSVLDVTEPASPRQVGFQAGPLTWEYISDMTLTGSHAYLANAMCCSGTSDGWNGTMLAFDISRPDRPTLVSESWDGVATGVAVSGRYAYFAGWSKFLFDGTYSSNLLIFDVANPAAPREVGRYYVKDETCGEIAVAGAYAYFGMDPGLRILRVSDPTRPAMVAGYSVPGGVGAIALASGYAYITDASWGLRILSLANPAMPVEIGSYRTVTTDSLQTPTEVVVAGNYAYLLVKTSNTYPFKHGVRMVDISKPAAPVLVGSYDLPGEAAGLAVAGDYIYVAGVDQGLIILRTGDFPTYSISGRVTDASGRGIPNVTVWAGFPRNTTTDANGNYTFTGLSAGTHNITPSKDPYTFSPESISVTVPPSASSINFTGQIPIVHVKLLYVPLNWQNTQAAFDAEADLQSGIFFNQIPLSACPEKYKVEKLNVAAQNFAGFTCSGGAIGSIREFLRQNGINPQDYTAVIGLAETSPCPPTQGQSNGTNTVWITAEYDVVTAHELGHVWGLSDQYCSDRDGMSTDDRCNDGDIQGDGSQTGDVNWLDSSLPCDCPSDWSADSTGAQCCNFTTTCNKPEGCYFKGVFIAGYNQSYLRRCDSEDYGELGIVHVNYGACCLGNKTAAGGRSIMSAANAPGPRAFDTHDLTHLNTKFELNCDVVRASQTTPGESPSYLNQRILDASLLVHQDDAVEDKGVRVTWGRPTPDSVLQGLKGDYSISILDADGGQVWSQAFPLHFDYTGPVILDGDYSAITYESKDVALRIPYTCGMKELKIYHSDRLIFSRTLPTVCPIYLPLVLRHN